MPTALVICRGLHFAATMLLFGAGAFLWALVPTELARAVIGPVRRMIAVAIVVAAITAMAWVGLEAAQMGDGWIDSVNAGVLADVLLDTAFGHVWQWRLGLALVLVGALAFRRHDRWAFVVPVSALLLASLGLTGHAIMQSGQVGALHRINDALHLLAAGAWLGGLLPFILCLGQFDHPQLRSEVGVTLRRFSGVGHFIVALVVLTGVINTALTLGAWPIDLSSPYQTMLAIKIAIVAAMIAMALFNCYVLAPRMTNETGLALQDLKIDSIAEVALGATVLGLVSVFGILAPV
jgi:putative copper resistance protein D